MAAPPPAPPPAASFGALPPGAVDPRAAQLAMMQRAQGGMAKGGAVEDGVETPRAKGRPDRQWGDVGKPAEDLPEKVERKAKGGVIRRKPFSGKKKAAKVQKLPPPMVTDEDMDAPPPPTVAAAPVAAPPPAAAPPPPPPGMKKGGKCMAEGGDVKAEVKPGVKKQEEKAGETKGFAAGGVAKVRRGFPNTNKKPAKKMATGGSVRGCGVAKKGCGFAGIF